MARYAAFLGRIVKVQYRAADILLSASGTFVADSGRSIFLQQHFEQRGQQKYFRWEIPYQYIVRLEETTVPISSSQESAASPAAPTTPPETPSPSTSGGEPLSAAASASAGGAPGILPLSRRPKTA